MNEISVFNLNNLNDQFFATVDPQEILGIKLLSTEDKVKCFKYFLTADIITNISVLANIFTLLNGITDIDEANEKDYRIFFNGLDEYVDIKLELKSELKQFGIKLIEYYLGVLEGLDVLLDERKSHIPNLYFNILQLSSARLISKLMGKYLTEIDLSKIKPAHCAEKIYNKINNPASLMSDFVQTLMNEVTLNDSK